MLSSVPDSSWQDGTMTSNDRTTLLMPEVRLALEGLGIVHEARPCPGELRLGPTELAKIPAVVLVEGLATPREVAPPREEPQP
ncbi:hypothetical protein ART_0547 [Arthrobacter sp. PAMC 25486]|uniref:hypothetical protein n=1 Tax=Arthrobacter sp. PAMC 25486 TaxID=1494608 RepID=UPI000535EF84|nr:hypothetical protein [Arthrobacter sp. PAMC 25486]AIY00146.1 hypothetical protein ART_0547 [Arthrobacter sp. PAMC 25486]